MDGFRISDLDKFEVKGQKFSLWDIIKLSGLLFLECITSYSSEKEFRLLLLIITVFFIMYILVNLTSKNTTIHINGKLIEYKGKLYEISEIDRIESRRSYIRIYSDGKLIVRTGKGYQNSDKFLTWAKINKIEISE